MGGESKAGGCTSLILSLNGFPGSCGLCITLPFLVLFFWGGREIVSNFLIVKKPGVPMVAIWFWPTPVPPALVWSWGHKVVHIFEAKSQSSCDLAHSFSSSCNSTWFPKQCKQKSSSAGLIDLARQDVLTTSPSPAVVQLSTMGNSCPPLSDSLFSTGRRRGKVLSQSLWVMVSGGRLPQFH